MLIASTCFLYLVGAGLFSKGVWHLEAYQWNMIVGGDAAELGSGPGSYDIRRSVWHVNVSTSHLPAPPFHHSGAHIYLTDRFISVLQPRF